MKKRLPIVLIAAAGIFLWRGGFGLLPGDRELSWKLWGDFASIRHVDVQLYDGEAVLVRSQLDTPGGATFEPTTKVSLTKGTYQGVVLVQRFDGGWETHRETVRVDETSTALTIGAGN